MPVMFLSDLEAASYGRYGGSVPQADLERFFYLDDAGQALVAGLRGDHNRLGFSVQLTTARYIGRFLADPLEGVPPEVIDYLAGQLQIADPSCVKKYAQRQQTHLDHAGKIRKALKLKDFAQVEAELAVYAGRRAWVTGDSPKAIFADAVGGCVSGMCCCRGDHAGPAGGAGAGCRDRAAVGEPVRGDGRSGTGGAGCAAGGAARRQGVGAGAGGGPGRPVRQARRWSGAAPGRRDHRVGVVAGGAGRLGDAPAAG